MKPIDCVYSFVTYCWFYFISYMLQNWISEPAFTFLHYYSHYYIVLVFLTMACSILEYHGLLILLTSETLHAMWNSLWMDQLLWVDNNFSCILSLISKTFSLEVFPRLSKQQYLKFTKFLGLKAASFHCK